MLFSPLNVNLVFNGMFILFIIDCEVIYTSKYFFDLFLDFIYFYILEPLNMNLAVYTYTNM